MIRLRHEWVFRSACLGGILAFSGILSAQTEPNPNPIQRQNKTVARPITQIEFFSDDIVHITHLPGGSFKAKSFAVVMKPRKFRMIAELRKGEKIYRTSQLQVVVDEATGRVRFLDLQGKPILEESKNGTVLTAKTIRRIPTTASIQRFDLPKDEAIYGLGQHQGGFMNLRGERVKLLQENKEIAIPVLLSPRGYGVFWDNPAVTEVSVGAGILQMIPATGLLDEKGQPGGLTARYFDGESFDKVGGERKDPQIDFNWTKAPINGLKQTNFSVRWDGFLQAPKSGTYQLYASADDGVRVWVDGVKVIDDWQTRPMETFRANFNFKAGSKHKIRVEYYQAGGGAEMHLAWALPANREEVEWNSEAGNGVDYYFLYGPEPSKVISAYRTLTGKAPMFPKWAWGFWQCRERYETQAELLGVVDKYRQMNVPLDGIIQDWFYWRANTWGSHEFDPARYPDPDAMVKQVHDQNAHIIISVWAKFDQGLNNFKFLEKEGVLFKPIYPIGDPNGVKYYDPFGEKGRELYWKLMSDRLFTKGFDGWWLDASEPELGGNFGEMRDVDTAAGPGFEVFNAFPLMHTKAVYEGQRKESSDKRVFILTRSAWAGQQRNSAVSWSGDIASDWSVYAKQIPAGLNFVASGIPYWNTDIGGFFGNDTNNPAFCELFIRWFQYGAFCPMFRVHGTGTPKEIYRFKPELQAIEKKFIELRYRLMPYIYSTSWQVTHENGSLMRPLVFDFAKDAKVYDIKDQFLFGPSLMVNPVTKPKADSRLVYLPAKAEWYDFWTGDRLAGGQTINANAPLDSMPIYVRAGSILPMAPVAKTTQVIDDPIELRIYPGADGSFTLYEDEGNNYNYEQDAYSTIPITWSEKTQMLTIGARKGSFVGMPVKHTFHIVWVGKGHGTGVADSIRADSYIEYSGFLISLSQRFGINQ